MMFLASLLFPTIICMSHQVNQNNLIQTSTKDLKGDMESEVERIQTSLKIQDAFLVKLLTGKTEETDETIKDYMKHMDTVLDKMAYIQDYKMEKINTRVNEHIYQTEAYSLIIIMDQLDKKHTEIDKLKLQIQELNRTLTSESEKCKDKFTCYDCLQDTECGWCSMDDKCVEGDDKGPLHISCNFYNYKQCNGRQCHKYQTCALCISDPSCGWCQDDNRYLSGCIQQPYNYQGCPKGGWYHTEAKSNRCPSKLIKAYEEEFDENSYWSKPIDKNEQAPEETAEEDKRNALSERGAKQESSSKVEYSKQQQAIRKQIEDLEKEIKIIEKEIKKLEKKLEEIKKWLKNFQEKNGMEEAENDDAEEKVEEKDEKEKEGKENVKDSKKSAKSSDKKTESKKNEPKDSKDSKDPKANKDPKKESKESKEPKKSKESKESKEGKERKENKDTTDQKEKQNTDAQKTDKIQEKQDSKDPKSLQKADDENSNNEELQQDSNENKQSDQSESKQQQKNDGQNTQQKSGNTQKQKENIKEKDNKNENNKNDEQEPEIPERYFKEDELENKKFEDIYHGNYEAKVADVDEIDFDHQYNDEDYFDDFNNYNY